MSKRIVILILLALLLGGCLAWLMLEDPGYVLIAFNHYTLEMSLWALLFLVLLTWLVFRIMRTSANKVENLGRTLINHDWFNRKRKNQLRMGNGLLQLMEGRWDSAWKNLETSAGSSEIPQVNLLGAAIAAFELGEKTEVDRLLAQAEKQASNREAVELVRARLLIRQGSFPAALTILEELQRRVPDNPVILGMMMDCYKNVGDWQKIQKMLPDLKRLKVVARENLRELKILVTKNVLRGIAAEFGQDRQALQRYMGYWNELPGALRKEHLVMKAHLQCLYQMGEHAELEKAIPKMLERHWDEDLVGIFGRLEAKQPANQLLTAESWLAKHPASLQLLLALARLCRRNQLWGKARDYLEQASRNSRDSEILLEQAELAAEMGEQEKSINYFRMGLKVPEKQFTAAKAS